LEDGRAGFGEEFLRALEASYLKIEKNPHRSPRRTVKTLEGRDLRKNQLRRFPIEVIYEIRHDEIVVLAVVSTW
jgi:mRNA-degrading endonuclease RelE of RelBE toxin-antitoxin system